MTTPQQTSPDAPPPKTSVILVVKGAGTQKPDETLSVFVNGFWPAIKTLDPLATIRQRADIFPSGYLSSPHDKEPHNHITEICTGDQRIWIKESYWEQDLRIGGALTGLQREWRMASYAFCSTLYELVFGLDSRSRKESLLNFFAAFVTTYWLVLIWPLWLSLERRFLPPWPSLYQFGFVVLLAFIVALIAATPMALETKRKMAEGEVSRLPAMANWVLIFLAAGFLLAPGRYLLGLLALAITEIAFLRARAMAWPFRQIANSDSDTKEYYSYLDANGVKCFGRRDMPITRLSQIFYRYIVVLALPLTFPGLILARFLKWTKVLGDVGDVLEATVNLVLGSVLGDVATYAVDPTLALQVRCAVETDLRFFHDRADVADLHVFAHSQGTPITFELLFNHLDDAYRKKIKTYVTIGSVLSYYHQANPVLDPVYMRRFPVRPYPTFGPDFKWMNFWNLADPITEFYGLDEYNMLLAAPPLDPTVERHPSSPTNIKTRATLENHSEYWSNLDLVQLPFAKRVLGELRPKEWNPDALKSKSRLMFQAYLVYVWLFWTAVGFGGLFGLVWALQQPWLAGIPYYAAATWEIAKDVIAETLPNIAPLLKRVLDWFGSPSAGQIHTTALLVTYIGVAALIALNAVRGLLMEARQRFGS